MSRSSCCGEPRPRLSRTATTGRGADAELAELAKALGHPARVAIVRLLLGRDACICGEIVDELPLAQSTVSQHLKVLRDAGLIRGEIDGPRTCYCAEPAVVERLRVLIRGLGRASSR